jgi:two-component system, NtrC family, nitrogen regulation sensor histidine kinase NtrY
MLRKAGILSFILFFLLLVADTFINRPDRWVRKLDQYIIESVIRDSAQTAAIMASESGIRDYTSLPENSLFSIVVLRDDSLIWWNTASLETTCQKQEDCLTKEFTSGKYKVKMQLPVFDDSGSIRMDLAEKAGVPVCIQKTSPQNQYYLNTVSKSYPVNKHCIRQNNTIIGFAFLCLIILISLIYFSAYKGLKTAMSNHFNSRSLIIYLVVLSGARALFLLPWIQSLFQPLKIFNKWANAATFFGSYIDLFLNVFLLIFVVALTDIPELRKKLKTVPLTAYCVFSGFFLHSIFTTYSLVIRSYVFNGQFHPDKEHLIHSGSLILLGLMCFSGLLYLIFHFSQNMFELLRSISDNTVKNFTALTSGLILSGLLWAVLIPDFHHWIILVFTTAYMLIIDAYADSKTKKITYLLWWLILFAAFLTANLYYFGIIKDDTERSAHVRQLYIAPETDIIKALNIYRDSLISSPIVQKFTTLEYPQKPDESEVSQLLIPYSLINDSSGIFDISVEIFDRNGSSLFANHFANYLKTQQSLKTAEQVSDFIFYNPFEEKYFLRFEIENEQHPNSPFLLVIDCEPVINNYKIRGQEQNKHFDYVIFYKNEPVIPNFSSSHRPDFNTIRNVFENTVTGGFSFYIFIPKPDIKIVTFREVYGLIRPISLFSFVLTISGFLIILLTVFNTRYDFLPDNLSMKFGARSSLKTKIQSAIILLILTSFLIIGLITAFYFKNLFEVNNNDRQREETNGIIRNIQSNLQNIADEDSALRYLQSRIKEISFIHNRDMSLFDGSGRLLSTTEKSSHLKMIPFKARINSTATTNYTFENINSQGQNKYDIHPLHFNRTTPFAFFSIRYPGADSTTGSIFEFLSTILNVYIFLFLLAGAIAITISNSITQPLTILADKLRQFRLGKTHDPLEWKSNDEIGELINDYNNLSVELHRSADMLAKTERDIAWREMAKQVAHEIKNPLTPMKLSIQYLEKAAKASPERAAELIPRVSATLIEQIDNLTQIANEFSNFATMPQASNEKIVLNDIVETIHDLFRKRDDMDISLVEPIDELIVFADKNHLVRILNNLVKNAIQAIPEDRRGKIEIELSQSANNALIRVSDNGTGIPDHMKEKVFAPNFTTKSSGTGLGLAISANMIESFNGKIYFETTFGKGTDFYISIPLMRTDAGNDNVERVSLD